MPLLSLIAKLSLDKTGFDAGLSKAGQQASALGGALKGALAGAFSTAAIIAYTKHLIDFGSKINDLSKRTGIGTDALQEFGYAAKQNGADVEDVAKSFKALSLARQEAMADPKSKAAQAFAAFGISPDEIKAQSLEQSFKRIGESIRTNDFGASEFALVSELLGKTGGQLIPAFVDGLEKASEEARRLGIIIDTEGISKLDEMGDAVDRLAAEFRGPLAEAVISVADLLSSGLKKAKELADFGANFSVGFDKGRNEAKAPEGIQKLNPVAWLAGPIAGALKGGFENAAKAVAEDAEKALADALGKGLGDLIGGNPKDDARAKRNFDFAKIAGVSSERQSAFKPEQFSTPYSNSINRIGGFTGSSINNPTAEMKKQGDTMKAILRTLQVSGIKIQEFS